jgi:Sulfotransferase family
MKVDELIATARSETGLESLGPEEDAMREALTKLVDALEGEARLDTAGEQMVTGSILELLRSRLGVEEAYREHPEIEDQEVESVLFGLGLPRTASTLLINVLAQDPAIRYLRAWESWAPTPPPDLATESEDPRIGAAQARVDMLSRMVPSLKTMLPLSATGPVECMELLAMSFRSQALDTMAHTPSFGAWVLECDMGPAYRYHRRTLKMLQWRRPPGRWRLKTPLHMFGLESLAEVYPQARFVMTHRDPARVIPSVATLVHALAPSNRLDEESWRKYVGASQVEDWAVGIQRLMDFRERHGDDRFFDIGFRAFNQDPIGQIEALYAWLGETFTTPARSAMNEWLAHNERERAATKPPQYDADSFGLDADEIRSQFASYLERHPVALA